VSLQLKPDATPRFLRPRQIPYALREKIEAELDRQVAQGSLVPTTQSKWATPVVPVLKANGEMRLCGDYKCTVNPVLAVDQYPLPKPEDIFAGLAGGVLFTKLDLSQAYTQLPMTSESQEMCTIHTHRGLYRPTRLCFGVAAAPALFQQVIDSVIRNIPGVVAYLDDLLITGKSEEEHWERVRLVCERLVAAGFRLRQDKSVFGVKHVDHLGFRIAVEGISPLEDKVAALKHAPIPSNKEQLQSFLGLLQFYARFLPNLSTLLAPLHQLLAKSAPWVWSRDQERAFTSVKNMISSKTVLVHYDPAKPIVVSCDASSYGVGCVLSHVIDGEERPVAFASRTLTPAEKNYAQIDREALAIVFAVRRFHKYLFARRFIIVTDHKPLLGLFGSHKPVPEICSPRMTRWLLTLSSYLYKIVYREGKLNSNADAMSRLPMATPEGVIEVWPVDILLFHEDTHFPLSAAVVARETRHDPVLAKVAQLIQTSSDVFPDDDEFKPYKSRQQEFSMHDGCVLWGARVVIPLKLRSAVLDLLHGCHLGSSLTKARARSYLWWPGLDKAIEERCRACDICQRVGASLPETPVLSWEYPEKPWSRLHIDFAGPFQGHQFFVVVDAHSKWMEIRRVSTTSAAQAIAVLRMLFATHGLCDTIVSDNGSAFTGTEFEQFCVKNGVKHVTSAPFHPRTNGEAERAVRSFKDAMRKQTTGDVNLRIARFLLTQHTTPHSTTGSTPAELLMGRKLHIDLDRLRPDLVSRMRQQQRRDDGRSFRSFSVNDSVWSRNYSSGDPWLPGVIVEVTGPLSYRVRLTSTGREVRRHADQLKSATPQDPVYVPSTPSSTPPSRQRVVHETATSLSVPSQTPAESMDVAPPVTTTSPSSDATAPPLPSETPSAPCSRFIAQPTSPAVESIPLPVPPATPVPELRRSSRIRRENTHYPSSTWTK
jgi:hypothetical protein